MELFKCYYGSGKWDLYAPGDAGEFTNDLLSILHIAYKKGGPPRVLEAAGLAVTRERHCACDANSIERCSVYDNNFY